MTPAKEDLLEIDASSERLSVEAGKTFHSRVAKLLYMALRTRQDILWRFRISALELPKILTSWIEFSDILT